MNQLLINIEKLNHNHKGRFLIKASTRSKVRLQDPCASLPCLHGRPGVFSHEFEIPEAACSRVNDRGRKDAALAK